ncbi:MAG: hypothetical protein Q4E06_05735 [Lautropia sp.]|nr:hypothetical protein [Lautropia sp.]
MLAPDNTLRICLLATLLLTGCGGGSGGSNVSSSPTPPIADGNSGQGTPGGSAPGASTPSPGVPAPDDGPGGNNRGHDNGNQGGRVTPFPPTPVPPSNTAGPPTQVPATTPISNRWVSGDVLATMLTQQTRTTNSVDDLTDAFPVRAAVPWSGPGPGGQPRRNASAPNIYAHQSLLFQPHTPGRYSYQATNFWRLDGAEGAYNFNGLTTRLDVIVSLPYYQQNANEIQFDRSGPIARGTALLQIRDTIDTRVTLETLTGRLPGEQQLTLGNGGIYSVRQGAEVPYDQVLMRWATDSATFTEMLLLKGIDGRQARLCFNTHLPGIKRLSCTIWAVPHGWTLGQRLAFKGNYIVDDRSAQIGGSGLLYWQTPAY